MNILVTGGAGFIGSHVVEQLLSESHTVVTIDNFDPFYNPKIKVGNVQKAIGYPNYYLYIEDILDYEELEQIFTTHDIHLVVHLAAKAGVRPSIQDPAIYQRVNIEGTVNLLEQCRIHEIKKFIFASSSSVYGNNKKVPFSENDSVDYPISPYAATKKAGELLCYNYHHLYNMDIYCLRFFTVYGPRQRPEMAIHKFTRLIDNNVELPVYGYGKPERDYTHIDDIVHGITSAIQSLHGYEIINLGESKTIPLNNLIQLIEQSLGKKANKKLLPVQPGDIHRTFADISKAETLLDYHPATEIKNGIQGFVDWYKSNITSYHRRFNEGYPSTLKKVKTSR